MSISRLQQLGFAATSTIVLALLTAVPAFAGGPKYIAGSSYFNAGVMGQPAHWAQGQIGYYVDQGPLSGSVTNQQATAMVDAAAALWSAVPTAGVTLADKGSLNEDVNGLNIVVEPPVIVANSIGQIAQPADVTPTATIYPVAVIFDADGSVINAIYGPTASEPDACQTDGVFVWIDNLNPDATIAHAVILLNGLCASTPALLQMMSFELERAFGRILGLDNSQVNPQALIDGQPDAALAWPIMQPLSGSCGAGGGQCIPNANSLSYDDMAALNRLYPITAQNMAAYSGKQITATNTIALRGTVSFPSGYGMQGVNVIARPLDANGNPLVQYTVTAVTGANFSGDHGNSVTGYSDSNGNPLAMWGSTDPALQGAFDLSGIPLPPGVTTADYQITFEAIDPLYLAENSVGPYVQGQVTPSGTLPTLTVPNLSAGGAQTLTVTATGSPAAGFTDAIGVEAQPRPMPTIGMWCGRLSQVGQTDWFTFPVRGNRVFTIVTQAIDEAGTPSDTKAMPSIGVWDGFDSVGSTAIGATPGLNGLAHGETWLQVTSRGDDVVRIGIADLRGDGRPDYAYDGWALYADTVSPAHLPAGGGPITIQGMGFRLADTVLVGGQPALVTSVSPNQITAIAPPATSGATGSVDVEVDDLPAYFAAAVIPGGVSYESGNGDALTLVTAPSGTIPIGTPIPFTVTALDSSLAPAGGLTVSFTVTSGSATLACGQTSCAVAASGDGHAAMNVTAVDSSLSIVTASLTNGSSLQAHFSGGTPPLIEGLTPQLSLAAGATVSWTAQALVLNNGVPLAGQQVTWKSRGAGIAMQGATTTVSNSSGVATKTLTVGPLAEGQTATINACAGGANTCVAFTAYGARPEYARLTPVSGVNQTLAASGTPGQIVLRLLDMDGNPMAGGTVAIYQALYAWAPPCAEHSVCPPGALLSTQSSTTASAIDGSVTFLPASMTGVATQLTGLAASGNTASVNITIEHLP